MEFERVFVRISKRHGFKPPILKEIVFLRSKGHSNLEIADEVGISRNTVSHYMEKMRELEDDEAAELFSLVSLMMARHRRAMLETLKSFE
ncbi:winged helix-turn-helix transcriptional regulator [Candidatus Micrarchaeota archaeon]|nr:winged helix-turn-helix transcriptional regulator [Candidatus Micrarchaeota archaeon]MBI5176755.1 winged helix-turn-helix transcriptional regulator [Candidatus Micrarchaeota archaeon]